MYLIVLNKRPRACCFGGRAYNPGHILQSRDFGIPGLSIFSNPGIAGLTFFKSRDPGIRRSIYNSGSSSKKVGII